MNLSVFTYGVYIAFVLRASAVIRNKVFVSRVWIGGSRERSRSPRDKPSSSYHLNSDCGSATRKWSAGLPIKVA